MTDSVAKTFDPYHLWLGIPAAEQPPSLYRLLGITNFESNLDVIASAADRQMSHIRSFQTGKHTAECQQLLNEIARAKVNLLHPEKKAAYDEKLKRIQQAHRTPSSEHKLPVATPLGPSRPTHRTRPSASVGQQRKKAPKRKKRSGNPILASVGGAVLTIIGIAGWVIFKSYSDVQQVDAIAPTSEPEFKPLRASEVNVEAFKNADSSQANVSSDYPNGPQWQMDGNSDKNLDGGDNPVESAASQIPDVRTDVASASVANSKSGSQEEPTSQSLPDFEKIATTSQATKKKKLAAPAAKVVKSPSSAKLIKQNIPSVEEQRSIRSQIIATYKPQETESPSDKVKLAREMVQAARTIEVASERYVLLSQASEVAESAGDITLSLQIVNTLGEQFTIDANQQRERLMMRFAHVARRTEEFALLVVISKEAIKQALANEQGPSALKIAEMVVEACMRLPGREFRKDALQRRDWVERMSQRQEKVRSARTRLISTPENGIAHLILARWYCFFKNDWEQGLPHLCKCSDGQLSDLASRDKETDANADVVSLVAIGDAWWDLASRYENEEYMSIKLRSGYWYQFALDGSLVGLKRIRLEKRLEELEEIRNQYRAFLAENSLESSTESLWNAGTP